MGASSYYGKGATGRSRASLDRTAEGGCPHMSSHDDGLSDPIEGCSHVVRLDGNRGQSQERGGVVPIGQEGVPILKQADGPAIFSPFEQRPPTSFAVAAHAAAINAHVAVAVDLTGLDHGREEDIPPDPATIDRRTADRSESRQLSLTVEPVDVIRFEWRIGGKVEAILHRDERDRPRLLVALEHGLDPAEVAGGAQDAAFVAVIAGQHPKAIFTRVVDNVVHMADGPFGECIGDTPTRAAVDRSIDVHFFPTGVVEVLSPKDRSAGDCCNVQWAGAASDGMGLTKLAFIRAESDDRSGNRGHESA